MLVEELALMLSLLELLRLLSPYLLLYFLNSVACFYSNVLLKATSFFDSGGYPPMGQSCNLVVNCLSSILDDLLVFGGHFTDS